MSYQHPQEFSTKLLAWYHLYGRKDLPWQTPKDPYRVWISEIMLQQTQVQTVIPFFECFIARFPNVYALSQASEDEVLSFWSGLGYYSRARNLYKTAKIICERYQGQLPKDPTLLMELPGIGASTAAAIASLAFDEAHAILDANVKRVLARYFRVAGSLDNPEVNKQLWQLAKLCMPEKEAGHYTQAIMDLGATCCKLRQPNCILCPLQTGCAAYRHKEVSAYPFKTVKKVRPIKKEYFFLLHTKHHQIYLEKRPPKGIWAGLWCLPTTAIEIEPTSYLKAQYDLPCSKMNELFTMKHSFTHFHLHITALALEVEKDALFLEAGKKGWFAVNEYQKLGIAKPVRKIIEYYISCNSPGCG